MLPTQLALYLKVFLCSLLLYLMSAVRNVLPFVNISMFLQIKQQKRILLGDRQEMELS
jgi:hypothetical protein